MSKGEYECKELFIYKKFYIKMIRKYTLRDNNDNYNKYNYNKYKLINNIGLYHTLVLPGK